MKLHLDTLLPSSYALFSALTFIAMMSCDIGINTLTICVYLANIIVVYILHKIGKVIDEWLRH